VIWGVGAVDSELEVAAAASIVGLSNWRARHPTNPGSRCANCATPLEGPYCHACGQVAESFDRSVWSLAREAVENFFDADGRVFHTLGRLALRPATLTKDYIAGRRASQTPPLRLFLVVIVLVFFAGGLRERGQHVVTLYKPDSPTESTPNLSLEGAGPTQRSLAAWLNPRLNYAVRHQQELGAAVAGWLHRIAIIFLPVATLLLGLLFVFRRRFFLFDHAIFSMHSLSFMGLLFTVTALLGTAAPLRGTAGLLSLAAPTHLFVHMRGVYGTGVIGTLLRMLVLLVLSAIGVALLLLGAVAMELNGMGVATR